MEYVSSKYDLSNVAFSGASAGALTAVLGACRVNHQRIFDKAYELTSDAELWNRKLGVIGKFGEVLHNWLDDLLPNDADTRCRGRVHVLIQSVGSGRSLVSDFKSRNDVIDACRAATHVPFVMDYKPFGLFREKLVVDAAITLKVEDLVLDNAEMIWIDHHEDPNLESSKRFLGNFALDGRREGFEEMVSIGREYGRTLEAQGKLKSLRRLRRRRWWRLWIF